MSQIYVLEHQMAQLLGILNITLDEVAIPPRPWDWTPLWPLAAFIIFILICVGFSHCQNKRLNKRMDRIRNLEGLAHSNEYEIA